MQTNLGHTLAKTCVNFVYRLKGRSDLVRFPNPYCVSQLENLTRSDPNMNGTMLSVSSNDFQHIIKGVSK